MDIFGTFYAGYKPKPIQKCFGEISSTKYWVSGSHDGFKRFGLSHTRFIEIETKNENLLLLKIKDKINSSREFYWRYWNHLAPNINQNILDKLIEETISKYKCEHKWSKTSFAESFGDYKERNSLSFFGNSTKKEIIFEFRYALEKNKLFRN